MSDEEEDNLLLEGQIENGHLPEDLGEQAESDQFDITLPTSHRYLGKLDHVSSGYRIYQDGEVVTLPGILTRTLVFPGFTLPLVFNNDLEINMLQRHTQKHNSFLLLTPHTNDGDNFPEGIGEFAIIMEIFQSHIRNDSLYLKARGRQRCQVLPGQEIVILFGEIYQMTVRVFEEPRISSPIANTQLNSLKIRRAYQCSQYSDFDRCRRFRQWHLSQYPLASWVYDKHETCFLIHKLICGLSKYYVTELIPTEPITLSYWFVQNVPLDHEERLQLMEKRTAVERLRLELQYLRLKRKLCCVRCRSHISEQTDVFPMSKDGVQSNYCNPGGFVYETVTVREAANFALEGPPSAQFSWFPGYSWTIMQCEECKAHLGWMFTSHTLKPTKFYGLAKNRLRIQIEESKVV